MIKQLLRLTPLLFAFACGSGEEPRVMTRDGALKAEIRKAEGIRNRLQDTDKLEEMNLGRKELLDFNTEFAFWHRASLYFEDDALARVRLTSKEEHKDRFEEFYFDRKGNLVLAEDGDSSDVRHYYFLVDRLVLALTSDGDTLKLDGADVKLSSINLVKEAAKLKKMLPAQ